jgi:hypothetical protein
MITGESAPIEATRALSPPPFGLNRASGGDGEDGENVLFSTPAGEHFPQLAKFRFPQVLVSPHDFTLAYACFLSEVGDAEDGVQAAAGGTWGGSGLC